MNLKILFILIGFFLMGKGPNEQKPSYLKKDKETKNVSIYDFNWIVGYWEGTGLGGQCEELWLPPVDNSMIGTFRFFMDGVLIFTEYMHILEDDGKIFLKLKHFNRDLSPWEEKDIWTTFPFIKMEEHTAYFEGLTIQRDGDEMILYLSISSNGERRIEEFKYRKSEF
ncbi:DUF6265 family protein [Shivajiella indica]|uniref:DUF6265 family protein n=1 Tax=Shivajiella indica TaxID=872115 RepID=A0ABW5BFY6_9BACT